MIARQSDGLDLEKFVQALGAVFATDAGLLVAAARKRQTVSQRIDADGAGTDAGRAI